jgi:hypothetical protein
VLDFVGSAAQGDILYRGASTWTRLGAGTSGQYLKTQGAGANPVWASVTASSAYRADFCLIDSTGQSGNISDLSNDSPFPDAADFSVFRTEFVPTNFTIALWCINGITSGYTGEAGLKLEYTTASPPTSGWAAVSGSTLNVLGKSGEFVYVSSTVTITGSPSAVYWRLKYVNTLLSGGNPTTATFATRQITLSLWN